MEENKKESVFKKIENNILLQVVFFVVSMAVIVGAYVVIVGHVNSLGNEKAIREAEEGQDYNVLANVEEVETDGERITISGWGFRLDSVNEEVYLVLKELGTNEEIILKTTSFEKEEVEDFFNSEFDFETVGFATDVKKEKLNTGGCYELLIGLCYEDERGEQACKISLGQYLYDGELYRYNPKGFKEPQISDKDMLRVIDGGTLLTFDMKNKLWIYEYAGNLYYILDADYGSLKEENIGIPVMPHTSKIGLLPENRRQYGFDHIGTYYENVEYQKDGVLPYQVVKVNLPNEYPITYIDTGLYDNTRKEWICSYRVPMAGWSYGK